MRQLEQVYLNLNNIDYFKNIILVKYNFSWKKLWTVIEVVIIEDEEKEIEINKNISFLWKFIDQYENEFSRFINNSSLNKLNLEKTLEVSDTFLDIFNKSLLIYRFTKWFFNPLLNLKNIWYTNSFNDNNFEIVKQEENLDLEKVIINWNELKLKYNQNLDFGWIAKWYLVDLISKKLEEFWYKNFLVNAWGDIFIKWFNNEWKKWVIWVENPYNSWHVWSIKLTNISISSSWSYKRHWTIDWKKYHHIVNPNTWENEKSLVGITIIAPKCYISDSLATAIFAMWMDKWKEFMIKNWIDWILLWSNKNIFLTQNFKQKYSFTNL